MDDQQRTLYRLLFRTAFLEHRAQAFENWFTRLAAFALGSDFERVAPHGADGDRKADARSLSDRTIYQCHAPERLDKARLRNKIEADFEGAVEHWGNWMRRWVFVHNGVKGLPAEVLKCLDALRARPVSVTIESWWEPDLTRLFERLDLAGLESVFGAVPSAHDSAAVAPTDVDEVVRHLTQAEPDPGEVPVRPPSVDKINKNDLSEEVRAFLLVGRRKDSLVQRYFATHPNPDLGEKIAEAFRRRYRALKGTAKSPDDVFEGLRRYIGADGSVRRQAAALTVLSYYFDRCDIFEDPDDRP